MSATLGASPGAARYPEHRVNIQASHKVWRMLLDGRTLAVPRYSPSKGRRAIKDRLSP